jgi:hypothetical protein
LRYVRGTLTHGLRFVKSSSLILSGFSDVDWQGVLMIEDLQEVLLYFLVLILFLGVPGSKQRCHALAQKRSISH